MNPKSILNKQGILSFILTLARVDCWSPELPRYDRCPYENCWGPSLAQKGLIQELDSYPYPCLYLDLHVHQIQIQISFSGRCVRCYLMSGIGSWLPFSPTSPTSLRSLTRGQLLMGCSHKWEPRLLLLLVSRLGNHTARAHFGVHTPVILLRPLAG